MFWAANPQPYHGTHFICLTIVLLPDSPAPGKEPEETFECQHSERERERETRAPSRGQQLWSTRILGHWDQLKDLDPQRSDPASILHFTPVPPAPFSEAGPSDSAARKDFSSGGLFSGILRWIKQVS